MNNIEKIYSKAWDYVLYHVKNEKIITVIFFDQIDYPRSFYLTDTERNIDNDHLSFLANDIRNNYLNYKDREIIPPIYS